VRNPPLCTLEQLGTVFKEGVYTLHDLADFHDYMDEEEENMRRQNIAQNDKERAQHGNDP
jgi:hypothetical protein